MGKDVDMNKELLDARLDAVLSAIQILSSVKEMKQSSTDHTEQLALDYIIKKILPRLENEKMDIIHAQAKIKVRLADDVIKNLDEIIQLEGNTKELKSYIGYLIINDFLSRKVEEEKTDDVEKTNNDVVNDIKKTDIEECDTNKLSSISVFPELVIIDGPLDDHFSDIYSNDINVISDVMMRFKTYLYSSISSEAETVISSMKEIYLYYYLDIKESFSNAKTNREFLEAYKNFNNYTNINFLSNPQKTKLMRAFKLFVFFILKVSPELIDNHIESEICIYNNNE